MNTADQDVAEAIGTAVDREISYLVAERIRLLAAAQRIVEIDDRLAVLQPEKVRIDVRRPVRPATGVPVVDIKPQTQVG